MASLVVSARSRNFVVFVRFWFIHSLLVVAATTALFLLNIIFTNQLFAKRKRASNVAVFGWRRVNLGEKMSKGGEVVGRDHLICKIVLSKLQLTKYFDK